MSSRGKVKSCLFVAGIMSMSFAAFADPPADTPQNVLDAGELIIDLVNTMSEPFADGSYYTVSVRPDDTVCAFRKTLSAYSEAGDETKVTVTTYDLTKIDPARIEADHLGGLKFRSVGDEDVFTVETTSGDEFQETISGDNFTVENEEAEVEPVIEAMKTMIAYCLAKADDVTE